MTSRPDRTSPSFFFQAEDGIRDLTVTGVQTCALPILICMGADVPHTVAAVAQRLNLRGISPETAHLAMDKLAMKDRLKARGVPIPWYEIGRASCRERVECWGGGDWIKDTCCALTGRLL